MKVHYIRLIMLSVFACLGFTVNGQTSTNYYSLYDSYFNAGKYDSALVISDEAAGYYLKQSDTLNFLFAKYVLKTSVYNTKGDFYNAHVTMETFNKDIDVYNMGANEVILYYFFKTYGMIYSSQDNYKDALKVYLYARDYCRNMYGETSPEMASLALDLSNGYRLSGEYQEALNQIEFAEKIYHSLHDTLNYAGCLLYRGNVYALTGDYESAIDSTLKCKQIIDVLYSGKNPLLAAIYNNVGVAYLYWDKHQEAIRYFKLAKQEELKLQGNNVTVARIWFNMGYSYEKLDSLDEAEAAEANAQELLEKLKLTNDALLTWSYNISARVFIKKNDYPRALGYVQYALYQNASRHGRIVEGRYVPYYSYEEIKRNPEERNCYDHNRLLESVVLKIDILQKLNTDEGYTATIKKSIADADTIAILTRNLYTTDKDKVEMMKHSFDLSDRAVNFFYNENKKKGNRENIVSAFLFSEKAKASVLLEVLRNVEAKSFAGVPGIVVSTSDSLQALISDKKELAKSQQDSEREKLLLEVQETQKYFKNYQQFIQQKYPDYYDLKYADNIVELTQLQQKLNVNTAILSYFIGDNTLSVFVITHDDLKLYQNKLNPLLLRSCKGLKSSIIYKHDLLYKKLAHELYNTLFFFPLEANIKDLVVVPHDFLSSVPFEALLTTPAGENDYTQFNYLVKKYNVSYAYSVSLFDRMLKKHHKVTKQQFLGIAPVFKSKNKVSENLKRSLTTIETDDDDEAAGFQAQLTRTVTRDEITPIPGTEIEVNTIKNLFIQNKLSAYMFLNEKATERSIKQHPLGDYKYIHIATHGFVDNDKPENSGIILHNGENQKEDNVLYAKEIYNLKLNADLVTLSACETGLGQIKKGEGLIGLTRPLLFAGAKNIMVSLWKVSDASTTELMIGFYQKLIVKTSYNQSLSDAKRQLINSKEFSQPYYWAAFVLIGE